MAESDLYSQWLGLPPKPRPPTPWLLLGLPPETADPLVIEKAASRQLEKLDAWAGHPDPAMREACADLMNQVARARTVVLKQVAASGGRAARTDEAAASTTPPLRPDRKRGGDARAARILPWAAAFVTGGVVGGAVVAAVLLLMTTNDGPAPAPPQPQPESSASAADLAAEVEWLTAALAEARRHQVALADRLHDAELAAAVEDAAALSPQDLPAAPRLAEPPAPPPDAPDAPDAPSEPALAQEHASDTADAEVASSPRHDVAVLAALGDLLGAEPMDASPPDAAHLARLCVEQAALAMRDLAPPSLPSPPGRGAVVYETARADEHLVTLYARVGDEDSAREILDIISKRWLAELANLPINAQSGSPMHHELSRVFITHSRLRFDLLALARGYAALEDPAGFEAIMRKAPAIAVPYLVAYTVYLADTPAVRRMLVEAAVDQADSDSDGRALSLVAARLLGSGLQSRFLEPDMDLALLVARNISNESYRISRFVTVARLLHEQGDTDDALAVMHEAAEVTQGPLTASMASSLAALASGWHDLGHPDKAAAITASLRRSLERGDHAMAVNEVADVWIRLAVAASGQDGHLASEAWTRALQTTRAMQPSQAEHVLNSLVRARAQAGDPDAAASLIPRIRNQSLRNGAYRAVAEAVFDTGGVERARPHIYEISAPADRISAFIHLARQAKQEQPDEAVRLLRLAMNQLPALRDTNARIGTQAEQITRLLLELGEESLAARLITSVPTAERDSTLVLLTNHFAQQGDVRQARLTLRQITARDRWTQALREVGITCAQAGIIDEAIAAAAELGAGGSADSILRAVVRYHLTQDQIDAALSVAGELVDADIRALVLSDIVEKAVTAGDADVLRELRQTWAADAAHPQFLIRLTELLLQSPTPPMVEDSAADPAEEHG